MNKHSIKTDHFDIELTLTCGQTFCWHRVDGELYGDGGKEFYSFRNGKPVLIRKKEDSIEAETELPESEVREMLGLHHDLQEMFDQFPEDEPLEKAKNEYWGLRIVQDEFFPCLISYLCSPQMRIPRIKEMHNKIAEKYGEKSEFNGIEAYRFPTPEQLGEATEDELRDLGVGYRAKYIVETVKIINETDFSHEKVREMEYTDAREEMKRLYGVGDKVADCVLLFSLGFVEAAPIDTWGHKVLEKHYPDLYTDDYDKISINMREYFGEKAGYAQEYLFHAVRNGVLEVEE